MWTAIACLVAGGAVVLWVRLQVNCLWDDLDAWRSERQQLRQDLTVLQTRVEALTIRLHAEPKRRPSPFNDGI